MQLLSELVGKKVTVFSEQGETERQDVVVIDAVEGDWFRCTKSETEVLYFNTFHVRLVKPFDSH